MDINLLIIIIVLIIAIIFIFRKFANIGMTYVKSDIDGEYYLVRDEIDKNQAANILAKIRQNVNKLIDYLYININDEHNHEYKDYIIRLHEKGRNIIIVESEKDSIYTSYSVGKGEQIVFCLRSRRGHNGLHDLNLMMYVVLHEISHVACPIYDNHGPLFKKIFSFIAMTAVDIGIYRKINFAHDPMEYCGLTISDSII